MAKLVIRIDLGNTFVLGPGKAELLELIEKHGSIRKAAAAMDMSYRRAWLLIQEIETIMGTPAIRTETGGAKGGGTVLTDTGRMIVEKYRAIEKRATESVAADLRALTQMAEREKKRKAKRAP